MSNEKFIKNVDNANFTAGTSGRPNRIGLVDYTKSLSLKQLSANLEPKMIRQVMLSFPNGMQSFNELGNFIVANGVELKDVYFYDRPSSNELLQTIESLKKEIETLKSQSQNKTWS